ncbi:NAD(P)/FAD-dependent oxidoreductase [Saccharothrix sp. NPDC042600]|uniref:NAD(P)/FAD-dependent oxidoreductase n=1 Tax=Saccharothrix TaxID=2071 RepID=UPI00340340C8
MIGVVVVGAGLAGLSAARVLAGAGVSVTVVEAADDVGGRVRTDVVDGVRLDRGFQILLPAYPELARAVDVAALRLRHFRPGVLVHDRGRRDLLADPRSGVRALGGMLRQRVLSPRDALALGALSTRVGFGPVAALKDSDRSTREELRAGGLSERAVERVLKPFLSGVFLEGELATSSRFFQLVWRCFVRGGAAVPADGMGALPRLLAAGLPAVRCGVRVVTVRDDGVDLADGTRLDADAVVVATDGTTAAALLPGQPEPVWNGVTTWYFRPPESPLRDGVLLVDAEGGPVVDTAVMSEVAPSYSPDAPLVQASALDASVAEAEVRAHLARLYGVDTRRWESLARYDIPHAVPAMRPPHPLRSSVRAGGRRYVCGDHRDTSSIQGALVSGRRAARAVLSDLRVRP